MHATVDIPNDNRYNIIQSVEKYCEQFATFNGIAAIRIVTQYFVEQKSAYLK